jgi:uncharacterized membrane protein YoaK (UPF0700 family)
MNRYRLRYRVLAACLSSVAGYVDALGFLRMNGFFVSFMSGNSTRLAVGLAGRPGYAAIAGSLVALFVVGVVLGAVTGRLAGPLRKSVVLVLVSLLLAAGAVLADVQTRVAISAMVLAMGAANAVFLRDGEVSIPVTYMTGTLVKLGQGITAAFFGGDRWAWLGHLGLWAGLVAGAVLGALVYPSMGLHGLWFAAGLTACLALATRHDGLKGDPV